MTSSARGETMQQLDQWIMQLEKDCKPLAFEGRPDQAAMMRVAQYSDERVQTPSGSLRAWYVCMWDCGGQQAPCGTVMPSQLWTRRREDPGATGQKW